MSDMLVTRFDIWKDGDQRLPSTYEDFADYCAADLMYGYVRKKSVYTWTWRENGSVTRYTVVCFRASHHDAIDESNGYIADESVCMFFLIEEPLCDCCEYIADND